MRPSYARVKDIDIHNRIREWTIHHKIVDMERKKQISQQAWYEAWTNQGLKAHSKRKRMPLSSLQARRVVTTSYNGCSIHRAPLKTCFRTLGQDDKQARTSVTIAILS